MSAAPPDETGVPNDGTAEGTGTARRTFISGVLGLAAAGFAGRAWAAVIDRIDDGAVVSQRAVRLDPPEPGAYGREALYVALYGSRDRARSGHSGTRMSLPRSARAVDVATTYNDFGRHVVPTFEMIASGTSIRSQRPWCCAATDTSRKVGNLVATDRLGHTQGHLQGTRIGAIGRFSSYGSAPAGPYPGP